MMSNSMFDGNVVVPPQKEEGVTQEQVNNAQKEAARDQFNQEVARYQSLVLGKDDLKPKELGGRPDESVSERLDALERYAGDVQDYCQTLEDVLKRFIYQNVIHMRGIALQGQKVNDNSMKVMNLASEAMNGVQKLVEVYGTRQLGLNKALQDIYSTLEVLIKDSLSETDIPNELDPDSGAAPDLASVNQDFLEGESRLIERARESGHFSDEIATEMLAKTVRQHGEAVAKAATKPKVSFTDRIMKRGLKH